MRHGCSGLLGGDGNGWFRGSSAEGREFGADMRAIVHRAFHWRSYGSCARLHGMAHCASVRVRIAGRRIMFGASSIILWRHRHLDDEVYRIEASSLGAGIEDITSPECEATIHMTREAVARLALPTTSNVSQPSCGATGIAAANVCRTALQ